MQLDETQKKMITIMVVDDEPLITNYLSQILKMKGYEILVSNNGEDAFRLFEDSSAKVNLIITDQNMPRLTGLKLSKKILETDKDMPIIICTGNCTTADEVEARKMGVKAYLTKPIKSSILLNKIYEILTPTASAELVLTS